MYLQHFGMTHAPLGNQCKVLLDDDQVREFEKKFNWLLESPGIGVLTAEPGLGKTALLRQLTKKLNPHQHQVMYIAETAFSRIEFYRQLATVFGLQPCYRRTQQWKELKDCIIDLMDNKRVMPLLVIDEAQNLANDFWSDFPSFLNFAFDSREMLSVWLLGHPELEVTLRRPAYRALSSRIQIRHQLYPRSSREEFSKLIKHGFEEAGCQQTLLSDTAIELIRSASQGRPRMAHQLIVAALRDAASENINHLPDNIVQQAIEMLQG